MSFSSFDWPGPWDLELLADASRQMMISEGQTDGLLFSPWGCSVPDSTRGCQITDWTLEAGVSAPRLAVRHSCLPEEGAEKVTTILAPLSEDSRGEVLSATSLPLHHKKGQNLTAQCTRPPPGTTVMVSVRERCWADEGDQAFSPGGCQGHGEGTEEGASISPTQAPGMGVDGTADLVPGRSPSRPQGGWQGAAGCDLQGDKLFIQPGRARSEAPRAVCTPRLHLTCKPDRCLAAWSLPSLHPHLPWCAVWTNKPGTSYLGRGVDPGPLRSWEPHLAGAVSSGPAPGAASGGHAAVSAYTVIWGWKYTNETRWKAVHGPPWEIKSHSQENPLWLQDFTSPQTQTTRFLTDRIPWMLQFGDSFRLNID